MSCSVAVSSSPVFSPSSSLFCNKPSILSPSPETLNLSSAHSKFPSSSSLSSPTTAQSSPSPSSPFRFRLQKQPTGLSSSSSSSLLGSDQALGSGSGSPQTISKRKRPGKLDIPVAEMSFAGVAMTPREIRRDELEEEREGSYSVYCKRGRREAMEDRFSAVVNFHGDQKQAFFGVFDGHGGAKAAEFAAENLDKNILEEVTRRVDDDGDHEIEEAIKRGYLNTDSEFLKEDVRGGSCCVTALLRNGNLVVSNAGDCRAVMSSAGGLAKALTSDHRPSREDEKNRIETLGGYVDLCHGMWRVQGSLAVSRGIGDRHLKQWVIAEPETKILQIKPEHEFVILASDGLWDKVSNQEAVDIARPFCIGGVDAPKPMMACKKLVELSSSRGSIDDISVMLIQLGRYI